MHYLENLGNEISDKWNRRLHAVKRVLYYYILNIFKYIYIFKYFYFLFIFIYMYLFILIYLYLNIIIFLK